ncbi:hypothetical protein FBU30_000091 [Linnemannia zychae]|nr:hypothetical protein FBU30_000091 [Linnemannia zychae]
MWLSSLFLLPILVHQAVSAPLSQQSQFVTRGCLPARIKSLVVFGDSFSDTGNVYELSEHTWPPSSFYPGGRFSNGPVWTDYVAKERSLELVNFAYGGATTDSDVVQGYSGSKADIPVPGFIQQIKEYYLPSRSPEDIARLDSTLFVVSFQGNDYLFNTSMGTETVLANIERGIHQLIDHGAQHIVVLENTDFGAIPYFHDNETLSLKYTALAEKQHREYQEMKQRMRQRYGRPKGLKGSDEDTNIFFNCARQSAYNFGDSYGRSRIKSNIVFFDLFGLVRRLSCPRRLRELGITDAIHGCVNLDTWKGCVNPDSYFFYDPYHSTTKVHQQIAEGLLKLF